VACVPAFAQTEIGQLNMELSPDFAIQARKIEERIAIISIDVETDYSGPQHEGLSRLPELIEMLSALNIPLTAFVEGKLFVIRPDLCEQLISSGADVQLHCYDHSANNETPESLSLGIAAYEKFVCRLPEGYRAGNYKLSNDLFHALVANSFKWDSSLLPAIGRGGKPRLAFEDADYFLLGNCITEFPIAVWRGIPIPLNQAYRRLITQPGEALLRRLCRLPRLLVYNMHMVDLVRTQSLTSAPLPKPIKYLYQYTWRGNRRESFDSLREFIGFLHEKGYRFTTASKMYSEVRQQ